MLNLLATALAELPALLETPDGWTGLRIDYHPPFVDRAWRPWRDRRLSIHRIHPCAPGDALFHPHPWPSAMRVLEGRYEMAIGYGPGLVAPPIAARLIIGPGTDYSMPHRDAWHDVRPLGGPTLSVMLSGPPWERLMPLAPITPQRPLPDAELRELLRAAAHAVRGCTESAGASVPCV